MKKLTTEYVRNIVKDMGWKLIGEYTDSLHDIKLECIRGHVRIVNFHHLIRNETNTGCRQCFYIKRTNECVAKFNKEGFSVLCIPENMAVITKVNISDNEGYKYYTSFINLQTELKRGRGIKIVHKQNPYSLENIQLFIIKNRPKYSFENGQFISNESMSINLSCKKCGMFWISSWKYIRNLGGAGCPYCAGKMVTLENSLAMKRLDLMEEWDYSKNTLNPLKLTLGSGKKAFWICQKCGHSWKAGIASRSGRGDGCPNCYSSFGEDEIKRVLTNNNVIIIPEYSYKDCKNKRPLSFDVYLPQYDILIEYQGEQHYNPIDFAGKGIRWAQQQLEYIQRNDAIKVDYCEKNNIPLLKIPYWDFNKIPEILISYLHL
jgi:protein-arginine kinase activator protein McsA